MTITTQRHPARNLNRQLQLHRALSATGVSQSRPTRSSPPAFSKIEDFNKADVTLRRPVRRLLGGGRRQQRFFPEGDAAPSFDDGRAIDPRSRQRSRPTR